MTEYEKVNAELNFITWDIGENPEKEEEHKARMLELLARLAELENNGEA